MGQGLPTWDGTPTWDGIPNLGQGTQLGEGPNLGKASNLGQGHQPGAVPPTWSRGSQLGAGPQHGAGPPTWGGRGRPQLGANLGPNSLTWSPKGQINTECLSPIASGIPKLILGASSHFIFAFLLLMLVQILIKFEKIRALRARKLFFKIPQDRQIFPPGCNATRATHFWKVRSTLTGLGYSPVHKYTCTVIDKSVFQELTVPELGLG